MSMNRRGATLVAFGLLLLPMVFLSALVLDMGKVYVLRAEAQLAADAAALAGGSGFIDGEGGGLVVARVHHYVNDNFIGGTKAAVDSIVINVAQAKVRLVLSYETGPLLLAESGFRLQARAGAQVTEEENPASEVEAAAPAKKLRLVQ